MKTRLDTTSSMYGDLEGGIASRPVVSVMPKASADDVGDDPTSEINCYGVGVIKLDSLDDDAPAS